MRSVPRRQVRVRNPTCHPLLAEFRSEVDVSLEMGCTRRSNLSSVDDVLTIDMLQQSLMVGGVVVESEHPSF